MLLSSVAKSALAAVLALPLLAACSAAPGDAAPSASVNEAVTVATGAHCSSHAACAVGDYCAPSSTTSACGSGTCTANPQNCPMMDAPVCGCDGNTYLNACWATIGKNGQPGTTSTGNMFVAPTSGEVAGTWTRTTGTGTKKTVETLVLKSNGSFTLNESVNCGHGSAGCSQASSAGTYTLSTVGVVFNVTSSTNAASLATGFYLENTCPIGGALQLVGAEPPSGNVMVTLTHG